MKLHYDGVSTTLLSILRKLMKSDAFADFRLVGGTALTLIRGHRRSIDIDLFTDMEYGSMPIEKMRQYLEKEFPIHRGTEYMNQTNVGYHVYLSDGYEPPIKVDLFYTEKFLYPPILNDGLRIVDQREIAAMKLEAIGTKSLRQKDYWDIHELLEDFSLSEMIVWAVARNPYVLTTKEIVDGLVMMDDVPESPEGIMSLKPLTFWELICMDLREEVDNYISSYTNDLR